MLFYDQLSNPQRSDGPGIPEEAIDKPEISHLFSKISVFILKAAFLLLLEALPQIYIYAFPYFVIMNCEYSSIMALIFGLLFMQSLSYFIITSLKVRVETMVSYAFGKFDFNLMLVTLQRAILIFLVLMIPVIAICFVSYRFFLIWMDIAMAKETSKFVICLIPSVIMYGLFAIVRSYLFASQYYILPFAVGICAYPLIIVFDMIFVQNLQLALVGVAISQFLIYAIIFALLIFFTSQCTELKINLCSYEPEAFTKWIRFVTLGYPLGGGLFIDFITQKIFLLFVQELEDGLQKQTYHLLDQVQIFYVMIQTALSIVLTNIVSNYIARKVLKTCQYSINISTCIVAIISLVQIVPYYLMEYEAISFFIPNESDAILLGKIIKAFTIILVLHNFSQAFSAYLRAIGQEDRQFQGYLYIHCLVTIPVTYLLTFTFDFQLNGILFGNILGYLCLNIFFLYQVWIADLNAQVEIINTLIKDE